MTQAARGGGSRSGARRSCWPRSARSSGSAWPPYVSPTSRPRWASAPAWSSTTSAPRTSWSPRRSPTPWSATSRPWTGRPRGGAAALDRLRAVLRIYGPTGSATGWRLWIDGWSLAQHEPVIAAHFREPGGPQPPDAAGARRRRAGRRQHHLPRPRRQRVAAAGAPRRPVGGRRGPRVGEPRPAAALGRRRDRGRAQIAPSPMTDRPPKAGSQRMSALVWHSVSPHGAGAITAPPSG